MKLIYIFSGLWVCLFLMVMLSIQPPGKAKIELSEIATAGKEERFTNEEMYQSCFSAACHSSEKNYIPNLGNGFEQSQEVRASVLSGRMPPTGWDSSQVKKFIRYVNSE